MGHRVKLALRSLPWYIAASLLLTPVFLIPFTAGFSLWIFGAYFSDPTYLLLASLPGLFIWVTRQFLRFAWFRYTENRSVPIH